MIKPTKLKKKPKLKQVGMFSIGRDGDLCFHEGCTNGKELVRTLNSNVTGGPYKAAKAYMKGG